MFVSVVFFRAPALSTASASLTSASARLARSRASSSCGHSLRSSDQREGRADILERVQHPQERGDGLHFRIVRVRADLHEDHPVRAADAGEAIFKGRRAIERHRGFQVRDGVVVEERSRVGRLHQRAVS